MTWIKIDDQLHGHPKAQQAWHAHTATLGLHLLALSHSAAYLTDGHVSEEFVRSQLPGPSLRRRVTGALVDAGLWERCERGWRIHDYLDFNEAREEVLARRAKELARRTEAGRRGGRKRWSTRSSTNGELIAPGANSKPIAPTPTPDPFKGSRSHPSIEGAAA